MCLVAQWSVQQYNVQFRKRFIGFVKGRLCIIAPHTRSSKRRSRQDSYKSKPGYGSWISVLSNLRWISSSSGLSRMVKRVSNSDCAVGLILETVVSAFASCDGSRTRLMLPRLKLAATLSCNSCDVWGPICAWDVWSLHVCGDGFNERFFLFFKFSCENGGRQSWFWIN